MPVDNRFDGTKHPLKDSGSHDGTVKLALAQSNSDKKSRKNNPALHQSGRFLMSIGEYISDSLGDLKGVFFKKI